MFYDYLCAAFRYQTSICGRLFEYLFICDHYSVFVSGGNRPNQNFSEKEKIYVMYLDVSGGVLRGGFGSGRLCLMRFSHSRWLFCQMYTYE